jgi:hypothetical protein
MDQFNKPLLQTSAFSPTEFLVVEAIEKPIHRTQPNQEDDAFNVFGCRCSGGGVFVSKMQSLKESPLD